jgi:hypothetical protein
LYQVVSESWFLSLTTLLKLEARFPSQETINILRKIPVIHHRPFPQQDQGLPGFFGGSKTSHVFIHPATRTASYGRTHGQLGAIGAGLNSRKPATEGPDYRGN